MEVIQINHCDTAKQLLWQGNTTECDAAIISDQYLSDWSVLEVLYRLNVVLVNAGSTETPIEDMAERLSSMSRSVGISGKHVLKSFVYYTHSDYRAIRYRVGERVQIEVHADRTVDHPVELVSIMVSACGATMPRKIQPWHVRRSVY